MRLLFGIFVEVPTSVPPSFTYFAKGVVTAIIAFLTAGGTFSRHQKTTRAEDHPGNGKKRNDEDGTRRYRSVSSGSGVTLGAVRRNFMRPSPVAFPARFLKKSAAVS